MGTATMQKWVYTAWVWFVVVTASTELSPCWHTYIPEPIIALTFHSQRQLRMTGGSLHCIEDILVCVCVCVWFWCVLSPHFTSFLCCPSHWLSDFCGVSLDPLPLAWCVLILYLFIFLTRRSGDDPSSLLFLCIVICARPNSPRCQMNLL